MSESKRATWREFFWWAIDPLDFDVGCAAEMVLTQREAEILWVSLGGNGEHDVFQRFRQQRDEWLESLRSQGVVPPADPPSAAEVLESVANEIANAGKTFCSDISGEEARQMALAFGCAVAIVRTKAREFT